MMSVNPGPCDAPCNPYIRLSFQKKLHTNWTTALSNSYKSIRDVTGHLILIENLFQGEGIKPFFFLPPYLFPFPWRQLTWWCRWLGRPRFSSSPLSIFLRHLGSLPTHSVWRCWGGVALSHQPACHRLGRILCRPHFSSLLISLFGKRNSWNE